MTLDYDQSERVEPPFSVSETEVKTLFRGLIVTRLQRNENHDQLKSEKGLPRFAEEVWLIESK